MGFVFAHMVGNLKMYLGAEEFNHYGEFLRELLVPILPRTVALWLMRIGLIGAFALHIHSAYSPDPDQPVGPLDQVPEPPRLHRRQLRQPHHARSAASSSACSSSGTCSTSPSPAPATTPSSGATRTRTSPSAWAGCWNAAIYIVANIALGFHLFHGVVEPLPVDGVEQPPLQLLAPRLRHRLRRLVVIGNVSFPIAVTAGIVSV